MRKKKNLILDFTSLLDVIMILLFVVICNMSNASLEANENAKKSQESLADAEIKMEDMQGKLDALSADNEALKMELSEYQINDGDPVSAEAYETILNSTTKVIMKCGTGMDTETNKHMVIIDIIIKNKEETARQATAKIIHDFGLSRRERDAFNAKQIGSIKEELEKYLTYADTKLIWVLIEYDYRDENFSNADLEIIRDAVQMIEADKNVTCYIEEMKK
ncbi:MAG: hypothetical protein NC393_13500 [Clostridium sp.]|nr:hypothetical protein [Clostridium sp.]MCM1173126.1 hypothetical protein [Clostridium sp.]